MVSLAATLEREDLLGGFRSGAAHRLAVPVPAIRVRSETVMPNSSNTDSSNTDSTDPDSTDLGSTDLGNSGAADAVETAETPFHRPVLLPEVMGQLGVRPGGWYVDGTVGDGGHTESLLRASGPQGCVLGIDLDPRSLARAVARLAPFGERFIPAQGSYTDMVSLARASWGESAQVDGVLLDLGISSRQVDAEGFGFSFQKDEPLDMRFDPDADIPTAAEIINTWPEADLARILKEYGEEHRARAIARGIERARAQGRPLGTTGELANLIARLVLGAASRGSNRRGAGRKTNPATRTFQALRIAVNDELTAVAAGLRAAIELLAPEGRLAVISYHSLEDRVAKTILAQQSAQCICPPGLPVCVCNHRPTLRRLNRRVIRPAAEEVAANPRSRSARLRVAQRLAD